MNHRDEAPESAFVREMKVVLQQRCAASTPAEKGRAESEMREIMRRYLGPAAWRAKQEQNAAQSPIVPRGTHRESAPARERKMAAAGRED